MSGMMSFKVWVVDFAKNNKTVADNRSFGSPKNEGGRKNESFQTCFVCSGLVWCAWVQCAQHTRQGLGVVLIGVDLPGQGLGASGLLQQLQL